MVFQHVCQNKMGRPRKLKPTDKRESNQGSIFGFFKGHNNNNNTAVSDSDNSSVNDSSLKRRRSAGTDSEVDCDNVHVNNVSPVSAKDNHVAKKPKIDNVSVHTPSGKRVRNFQISWLITYPWLLHDKENPSLKCDKCI